ncbi:MAG: polysaccharide biosynthesis C-terminal domain-containing protein [Acidobacteria bacterium]|nr:polysaccharide biosynthesis C-terminal domain-containing protein [Acidobacteriota bacterium]
MPEFVQTDAAPPSVEARRRSETRHLIGASALVSGASLVTKLVGVLRVSFEAAIFGANRAMDAFNVARTIPDAASTWIEAPVRAALVPLFTRRLHEQGEAEAWCAASNIINVLAVTLGAVVLLLYAGAGLIVRVTAAGMRDPAAWEQGEALAHVLVFSILFSVLAVVLGSIQNVYRRQGFPVLGQFANGIVVFAGVVLLGPRLGLYGFALGMVGGAIAAVVIQSEIVWRYRRFYCWTLRPFAPEVRELLTVAFPLFIGLTGTRIDVLLDRAFASFLPAGRLSILLYATVVSNIGTDLVLVVSTMVWLPMFAHMVAQKRFDELRGRLEQVLGGYLLLIGPATAVLCGGSWVVVNLFFRYGRFDPDSAWWTALALPVLAIASPVFGMGQIIAQVHISRGDTRTPMVVGFWRIGLKALLSIALLISLPWEYAFLGLAAASSASSFFRTAQLWHRLPPEMRPRAAILRSPLIASTLSLGVVAALAAALAAPASWGGWVAQLALLGGVAVAVQVGVAWWTGDATLRTAAARLLGRGKRP